MLCISLYPDKSSIEEDRAYLELARSLGYEHVFMSLLQANIADAEHVMERLRAACQEARRLGFTITLDVHPLAIKLAGASPTDLSVFHEMGATTLRLDGGYNGRTEAAMTRNPYGINIELNVSNDNPMLDLVLSYGADPNHLTGSCNFYPQRYTGMSAEAFASAARRYRSHHLRSAVFISSPSAQITPWPVSEGTVTLECHRDLPIHLQARHMRMLGLVDDVIIGNAYATQDELFAVAEEWQREMPTLDVEIDPEATQLERELLFGSTQRYRGDRSEYMIRSCDGRGRCVDKELPAHLNREVRRGDVLVLNEDYGQYKGEVQIALRDRPADSHVNVVGHVSINEDVLIDTLRPYESFLLLDAHDAKEVQGL